MTSSLAYFDTSAIAKRYVEEAGSGQVRKLLSHNRLLSSAITPLELLSAISRRRTQGSLRPKAAETIIKSIQTDRAYWQLADVTESTLTLAERIVQTSRLRALDAIHVASAQLARTVSGSPLPFVTADSEQRVAASEIGLQVIWIS
jgi:predicted nucleic acid-binding protein